MFSHKLRLNRFAPGLAAVLLFAAASPSRAAVFVSGRVVNTRGSAVPGSTVSLFEADETAPVEVEQSLANGSFVLRVPSAGTYRMVVSESGLSLLDETRTFPASGISGMILRVAHLPTLSLRLRGPTGRWLTGGKAQVWMLLCLDGRGKTALAATDTLPVDPNGTVTAAVPRKSTLRGTGEFGLSVRVDGVGCARVYLRGWPDEPIALRLYPGAVIQGRLSSPDGNPVANQGVIAAGLSLNASDRFLTGWGEAVTHSDGSFQIGNLFHDRYQVGVDNGGYQMPFHPVMLAGWGASTSIVTPERFAPNATFLSLRREALARVIALPGGPLQVSISKQPISIQGHLRPPSKKKVSKLVEVLLYEPGFGLPVDMSPLDLDGNFTLMAPRPGRYSLGIYPPAYTLENGALAVPARGVQALDLTPIPKPTLLVHVSGPDGKPLSTDDFTASILASWDGANIIARSKGIVGSPGMLVIPAPGFQLPASVSWIDIRIRAPELGCGEITLRKWPTGPVELKLDAGADLSGALLDEAGKAIPGAQIRLVCLAPLPDGSDQLDPVSGKKTAIADATGHFTILHLLPGRYYLVAHKPTGGSQSRMVWVAAPHTAITILPTDVVHPEEILRRAIVE